MPRRVDHEVRKRQITDAVARITVRGGISGATFREVAAEAGVSVRLIQYYFGSKDQLLLETLRHTSERATNRLVSRVGAAGEDLRDAVRALLVAFVPTDGESREMMLLFVALHTAALTDPALARAEVGDVPRALVSALERHLSRADLAPGANPRMEASILAAALTGLAQAVLDGLQTADEVIETIDYALDRLFA